MFGLGPLEIGVVALIGAMLFGAGKLPDLGKGMGKAITNFRKEVVVFKKDMKELEKSLEDDE